MHILYCVHYESLFVFTSCLLHQYFFVFFLPSLDPSAGALLHLVLFHGYMLFTFEATHLVEMG